MTGRAVRSGEDSGRASDDPLAPYVPRLVVDWLHDEPQRRYRTITGTCVFADISGFTALTERLSASGKVGAEEMADVLNATFDQLLTAAYDFGASLIKWGGDAVLLLFDGPGHAERAANGARSMQAVMRRIGRLQTSRGVVRLGMSIGVHTGDLDMMLVGGTHRELIVTGPVATTTALMEKVASRGEIVVSAATAAALPARCVGGPVGDGFLLVAAPDTEPTPNRSVKRRVDLAQAMCADLSAHLSGGVAEHEHRFVAVAFLKFSGTDRLLAEHGPDALTDAVENLVDQVEQAAADNGVTFLASDLAEDGGKFMLAAGAPHSTGDDATRMLATMRRVVHTGGRLDLTAGVTCGRVFAGDFGPFYRRTYSLAGDMVNLAARLASYARPGQVIAIPAVVERSRTAFEVIELPPFAVKGKARPIDAVVIGDPKRGAEHTNADRLPLVGRDTELETLLTAAKSAATGHGCVVDVVGPAGIGKSRLIEELTSRAGMQVLWADGDIYGRTTPYQPMQRMLRSTLGLPLDVDQQTMQGVLHELVAGTAPELEPLLPLIGTAAGVDLPSTPEVERLDPEVRRARLEAVTSDLLGRLLPGPIVMVLNDVHFMDDATLGLIRRLADDVTNRAWLMIVTRRAARDEAVLNAGPHVTTLELEPLDAAASAQLVAAATDAMPLPEHRARRLAERAGGNPLFLTHLVAGAADTDVDALPDTIEGVVAAQIDKLPARRRRWLRAASVLGMTVDPDLLGAVLAGSDLENESWAGLDEFIAMNVHGRLEFTHHLVQHSAYEGLPYRRRVDLHARTAHILEARLRDGSDEHAALLSLHCLEGAQYEPAWTYSRAAGDRARDRYAPAEAVQCYQRALSASVHLPGLAGNDVTDVLERLAETLMDIGEMDAAEHALRQARRRAKDDPLRSARLCLATAHHRQHMGRHVDSLRWITRGRSLLGGESSVEASKLRVSLGWRAAYIRYDQGAYKAGLVWARRAVDEARAINDDAAEATALAVTSVLEAAAGRSVDEARMREVMDVYDRIDDQRGKVRAANLFGVCLYFAGKWDAAVRYYAEAEQTFRSIGRDHDAAMVATNRAEVLVQQGRIDEAEALVASAVRVLLGARATSYLGFAITVYGRVALARGDYDVALDRLAEARSMCMEMGEVDEALTVDALVAECLQRAGNPVDALSYAEAALAQMSDVRGEVTAEPALHRVYGAALLAGGWPGGEQALRTSLATARRRGAPNEIFTSLDALLRHGVASDAAEAQTWRAELDELAVQLGIVTTDTDRLLFQPAVPIAVLTEPASGLPPEP